MRKLDFFEKWTASRYTCVISILGLIVTVLIFFWVGDAFEMSQYPVGIIESQRTFSGTELKDHFSKLTEQDTMGIYSLAQGRDFLLIISYSVSLLLSALCLARLIKRDFIRRLGLAVALFFPVAGLMDSIENIFLLLMLSDPQGFPDWLAIAYSGSASVKWLLLVTGGIWMVITVICLAITKALQKFRPGLFGIG